MGNKKSSKVWRSKWPQFRSEIRLICWPHPHWWCNPFFSRKIHGKPPEVLSNPCFPIFLLHKYDWQRDLNRTVFFSGGQMIANTISFVVAMWHMFFNKKHIMQYFFEFISWIFHIDYWRVTFLPILWVFIICFTFPIHVELWYLMEYSHIWYSAYSIG